MASSAASCSRGEQRLVGPSRDQIDADGVGYRSNAEAFVAGFNPVNGQRLFEASEWRSEFGLPEQAGALCHANPKTASFFSYLARFGRIPP